jgi:hypothetical protein
MKLKKLWLCIKNYIVGMKVSKLQKRRIILMLENSKKTTSNGCWKPIKKPRQQKLKKEKEITILQSVFI